MPSNSLIARSRNLFRQHVLREYNTTEVNQMENGFDGLAFHSDGGRSSTLMIYRYPRRGIRKEQTCSLLKGRIAPGLLIPSGAWKALHAGAES